MNISNVLLCGLPRSGTTLVCQLLNRLPETVALDEPGLAQILTEPRPVAEVHAEIDRFFEKSRSSILTSKTAMSKQVDGRVSDNPFGAKQSESGIRQRLVRHRPIHIDKKLSADFTLIVKQPALLTALLDCLVSRYRCYAIIRNPLSVLASWNCTVKTLAEGHSPPAERLDDALATALSRIEDTIGRQLHLMAWFFEKYRALLGDDAILRYERIVETGGKSLDVITPRASALGENLVSKNRNVLYDARLFRTLGERLLKSKGAYWEFYRRESVEQLLTG